jgi:5-methylcytosine-specific restriction enzyme A
MAYKEDKRKNRRVRVREKPVGFFINDQTEIAREKEKARKLRDSSWWRKKCAGGICTYCGKKVPVSELTMDHVIPLSRGGVSERFNIVPACKECNNKKKYLLPAEWEEYLGSLRNKTQQDDQ